MFVSYLPFLSVLLGIPYLIIALSIAGDDTRVSLRWILVITKTLPALALFVEMIALTLATYSTAARVLYIVAAFHCVLGDIMLSLADHSETLLATLQQRKSPGTNSSLRKSLLIYLGFGVTAFGAAQILFAVMYAAEHYFSPARWQLTISVSVVSLIAWILFTLTWNRGAKMSLEISAVFAYSATLLVAWCTSTFPLRVYSMLGAGLFLLSDSCIFVEHYLYSSRWSPLWVMITYWLSLAFSYRSCV